VTPGRAAAETPERGRAEWRTLARLLRLGLPHRSLLLSTAALLVGASALSPLALFLIRKGVDEGVGGADDRALLLWTGALGAVAVAHAATEYFRNRLTTLAGQRVVYDVRTRLFAHIHRLPLRALDRTPVGTLVTRVTSDVEALAELFSSGVAAVCSDLLTMAVFVVVLLAIDAPLALVALGALPVVLLVAAWFGRRMRAAFRLVRARLARLNGFTQEALTGVPVTRLCRREALMDARFEEVNRDYRDAQFRAIFNFAFLFPVIELLSTLATAAVLVLGAARLADHAITWGDFFFFWLALAQFFEPMRDLSDKFNVFNAALAAAERIFGLLDEEPEEADPADALAPARLRGDVEFRDVHLEYVEGVPALRGVSFRVRRGETVALVGATGAGKTSVIALLSRLWDPTAGEVRIDGIDARRYARRALRARIAVVMQDVFLFTGTIGENLRLGNAELSDDAIRAACEVVHADRLLAARPGGLSAFVHERGGNLSVGEKQLLAFARALAADPDVLVLDEATSSIDTETERLIQDALPRLLRGRTAIVIAHRLSTIRQADRILVLHHGRVVEEGRHEELLARNGLYAKLHALSYGAAGPA
jgi:ATP-binding cassette subfamily B multidrug efflux pump